MAMVKCPECEGNVSNLAEGCPHCGYPLRKKNPETEYVLSKGRATGSGFAAFLRVLAWIVWIGGLIISIAGAQVTEVGRYSSSTSFSFSAFLTTFLAYVINGVLLMGMASIVENISNTYSIVSGLSLDKRTPDSLNKTKRTNMFDNPAPLSETWICSVCKHENDIKEYRCKQCGVHRLIAGKK